MGCGASSSCGDQKHSLDRDTTGDRGSDGDVSRKARAPVRSRRYRCSSSRASATGAVCMDLAGDDGDGGSGDPDLNDDVETASRTSTLRSLNSEDDLAAALGQPLGLKSLPTSAAFTAAKLAAAAGGSTSPSQPKLHHSRDSKLPGDC